jgi:hypothetical protein
MPSNVHPLSSYGIGDDASLYMEQLMMQEKNMAEALWSKRPDFIEVLP